MSVVDGISCNVAALSPLVPVSKLAGPTSPPGRAWRVPICHRVANPSSLICRRRFARAQAQRKRKHFDFGLGVNRSQRRESISTLGSVWANPKARKHFDFGIGVDRSQRRESISTFESVWTDPKEAKTNHKRAAAHLCSKHVCFS